MATDAPSSSVLLVSSAERQPQGLSAALCEPPDLKVTQARPAEAGDVAASPGQGGPHDLIVIAPDVDQPLMVARHLRRVSPGSQLLFVRHQEELEPLTRTLAFVPDLSGAWAVDDTAGPQRIRPILAEAARLAQLRRQADALSSRLNLALASATEEDEAQRRRRQLALSQSFFGAVLSQAADPIFAADLEGHLLSWNEAASVLFGRRPEEVAGEPVTLPAEWREALGELVQRTAAGEQVSQYEMRLPRADGAWVDLSLSLAPVRDEAGQVACISFVARDITEQKKAEERQHLLVRELNHRVKNTLALVQALARRSAQGATSVPEFLEALNGRLEAMSAAHGLLSASWWEGAALTDLARTVLFAHMRDGRVHLDVEDVHLPPELASSLALVLNELGTNAVKYGALSNAHGAVHISARTAETQQCEEAGQQLAIEWRETGGPLAASPEEGGFGTRLVTQLISYQHQGDVAMDWSEGGLVCRLTLPLNSETPETRSG